MNFSDRPLFYSFRDIWTALWREALKELREERERHAGWQESDLCMKMNMYNYMSF
jgi:hypothetical protein